MNEVRPVRLLLKGLVIFLVINLAFAALNPPAGTISIYNGLVPGRLRFYLASPQTSDVAVGNLDALFYSHVIAGAPKLPREYRVFLVGDSQTWGGTVSPAQTLAEQLNSLQLHPCGKNLMFYNLAYPYPSAVKDFLILHRSLRYQPDLVVWLLAVNSLIPIPNPALNFLDQDNPQAAAETLQQYHLDKYWGGRASEADFWHQTIIGQGRYLASLTWLQLDGLVWAATGSDYQFAAYAPLDVDLPAAQVFYGFPPPQLPRASLAFDVLDETHRMLGPLPVLVVNEPIYIAHGKNSNISYNAKYPRWAYDQYREFLRAFVAQEGWTYLDLYDLISSEEFTNSILHIDSRGEARLARSLAPEIQGLACR
ncbi:MAG TPA: hypothetical protein VLZ89_11570 [Anaerolineales bacterium]|nr:hypothetical protein [Anaerolineales bacterium]